MTDGNEKRENRGKEKNEAAERASFTQSAVEASFFLLPSLAVRQQLK
jgi:hypothetical protein